MFNNGGVSLSDIAAVTRNGSEDTFGGNGAWWVLIILFAMFGGFGNFGAGNRQNQGGLDSDIQRGFDFNGVTNKLNSIGDGICSLGYDQLKQVNDVNQNLNQLGFNLSSQLAKCCCDNQAAISEVRYDMGNHFCGLGHQIDQMGHMIMQNDNNNYRALHDELFQMKMEAKDETIARQHDEINTLRLAASQCHQNEYIVGQLAPKVPIPSYNVPNPYCCTQQPCCTNCGC